MSTRRLWVLTAAALAVALLGTACSGGGDDEATEGGQEETQAPVSAGVLALSADTVFGPANIPEDQAASQVCVLASRFPRNSEIVWRARVIDPVSGEEMDDSMLDSVVVTLADGQEFEMRYGPHPADNATDFFWTTSFDVPKDYPTGTLSYEIVATGADDSTGTFKPFDVAPSLLTITDDVLKTIEEEG